MPDNDMIKVPEEYSSGTFLLIWNAKTCKRQLFNIKYIRMRHGYREVIMKLKLLLLTVLAVVVFLGSYVFYGDRKKENKKSKEEVRLSSVASVSDSIPSDTSGKNNRSYKEDTVGVISCYICGEVVSPGVYEIEEGSRINDLLIKAGGFTESAEAGVGNLAAYLNDGDMVFIPAEGAKAYSGGVTGVSSAGGLVNINRAGSEELSTLPGIGETKAKAILSYRSEHGDFSSIDEIMNVSGIGQNTYDSIKDYITV